MTSCDVGETAGAVLLTLLRWLLVRAQKPESRAVKQSGPRVCTAGKIRTHLITNCYPDEVDNFVSITVLSSTNRRK